MAGMTTEARRAAAEHYRRTGRRPQPTEPVSREETAAAKVIINTPRTPWVAAILAFVLGGPGCFHLGWRRGAKATLGWLLGAAFIFLTVDLPEPKIFFLVLLQSALAWKAYRSCQRSNAQAAKTVGNAIPGAASDRGATGKQGRTPLTGWKRATWRTAKWVLAVVRTVGVIVALFLANFGLVDWHYSRMQRSVRPGMTIEELLHTVQEPGLVTAYPQRVRDQDGRGVSLFGPSHGTYGVSLDQGYRRVSEGEATALIRRNMIPRTDYRIGFTFTPGVGPHWSMTVMFDPEGRVKEVQPFHPWD